MDTIRPDHYGGDQNPFEPIKVIQHYNLNFERGNAIKYILRAGKKNDEIEDLEKAATYLKFEIDKLKRRKQ